MEHSIPKIQIFPHSLIPARDHMSLRIFSDKSHLRLHYVLSMRVGCHRYWHLLRWEATLDTTEQPGVWSVWSGGWLSGSGRGQYQPVGFFTPDPWVLSLSFGSSGFGIELKSLKVQQSPRWCWYCSSQQQAGMAWVQAGGSEQDVSIFPRIHS